MIWQTRYLMTPQFVSVYAALANGYKCRVAGRWHRLPNVYLCADGTGEAPQGESLATIYPDGHGYWHKTEEPIRAPFVRGDVVHVGGAPHTVVAATARRLQAITEADAEASGAPAQYVRTKRTGREVYSRIDGFRGMWDAVAPDESKWEDDPWVWVLFHEPTEPTP